MYKKLQPANLCGQIHKEDNCNLGAWKQDHNASYH
jgi:hypothetical protein